jgi:hypothetical protein
MKKLHGDGILESFDFESIDGCEKFLEMIETPFKSYWKDNMKKLHVGGILESFDFESTDACKNFLEMIETPFIGKEGRTTNLLDIIHVDVYSSLCVAVCGGSYNFIYFNRGFE